MKTITTLAIAILLLNCSPESDENTPQESCECIKESYERTWVVNSSGTGFYPSDILISQQRVGCQDEAWMVDFDGTTYYNIVCPDQ